MNNIIIAPSILAADFGKLEHEIQDVARHGVQYLHIDVMDGHFVPPITFGDQVVAVAKQACDLFLDVHLMIEKPERQIDAFVSAGSDRIIVHQETCPHLHRSLQAIRDKGIKNGVAINPGTAVSEILDILDICDMVLVMTVNPGWGGQKFISSCLPKIEAIKEEITKRQLACLIEVDGGINADTAKDCISAGADVLVAGSYIFGNPDRKLAIDSLFNASS